MIWTKENTRRRYIVLGEKKKKPIYNTPFHLPCSILFRMSSYRPVVLFFFPEALFHLHVDLFQDGWAALLNASNSGYYDIAKILIDYGASVDLPDAVGFREYFFLFAVNSLNTTSNNLLNSSTFILRFLVLNSDEFHKLI